MFTDIPIVTIISDNFHIRCISRLKKFNISYDEATDKLQKDGVASFAQSFVDLLAALEDKREDIVSRHVSPMTLDLGGYQAVVDMRLKAWDAANVAARIWERDGTVYGKILKLINPDEPDPVCTRCKGKRQGQKITGMVILWGMTKRDNGWYEGGRILDPENGKIYGCKIRVTGGGSKLEVRGFLGISLLGRTQHWKRVR